MATIRSEMGVALTERATRSLRFLPPQPELTVVVHQDALRAPNSQHTQVACIVNDEPVWLGALGEDLLAPTNGAVYGNARALCARRFLCGAQLWGIVKPGLLVHDHIPRPLSTVYDGSALRPWVVIGETQSGMLIAVPLNDRTNPKWYTPPLAQAQMSFPGNNKDAQVELAHVWSLPAHIQKEGVVLPSGICVLEASIRRYFDIRRQ
jgi:hypothetical protein